MQALPSPSNRCRPTEEKIQGDGKIDSDANNDTTPGASRCRTTTCGAGTRLSNDTNTCVPDVTCSQGTKPNDKGTGCVSAAPPAAGAEEPDSTSCTSDWIVAIFLIVLALIVGWLLGVYFGSTCCCIGGPCPTLCIHVIRGASAVPGLALDDGR